MTLPYCRERSIPFLCVYVDVMIKVVDIMIRDNIDDVDMDFIMELCLGAAELDSSLQELIR